MKTSQTLQITFFANIAVIAVLALAVACAPEKGKNSVDTRRKCVGPDCAGKPGESDEHNSISPEGESKKMKEIKENLDKEKDANKKALNLSAAKSIRNLRLDVSTNGTDKNATLTIRPVQSEEIIVLKGKFDNQNSQTVTLLPKESNGKIKYEGQLDCLNSEDCSKAIAQVKITELKSILHTKGVVLKDAKSFKAKSYPDEQDQTGILFAEIRNFGFGDLTTKEQDVSQKSEAYRNFYNLIMATKSGIAGDEISTILGQSSQIVNGQYSVAILIKSKMNQIIGFDGEIPKKVGVPSLNMKIVANEELKKKLKATEELKTDIMNTLNQVTMKAITEKGEMPLWIRFRDGNNDGDLDVVLKLSESETAPLSSAAVQELMDGKEIKEKESGEKTEVQKKIEPNAGASEQIEKQVQQQVQVDQKALEPTLDGTYGDFPKETSQKSD